jgi:hypothetical protein
VNNAEGMQRKMCSVQISELQTQYGGKKIATQPKKSN